MNPCADTEGKYYTAEQRSSCNGTTSKITIGKIYNDVWAYRICNETKGERYFDSACMSNGWQLLHPGAAEGGCTIELGILVCTVPSERYHHTAVAFNDQTMYVYGGFSQRCVDFCDDIWFYDMYTGVRLLLFPPFSQHSFSCTLRRVGEKSTKQDSSVVCITKSMELISYITVITMFPWILLRANGQV